MDKYFCHKCGKSHTPDCDGYCAFYSKGYTCDKKAGHTGQHVDWDTVMTWATPDESTPNEYTKLITDHKTELEECQTFYAQERDKIYHRKLSFWERLLQPNVSKDIATAKLNQLLNQEKLQVAAIDFKYQSLKTALTKKATQPKPEFDSEQEFLAYLETKAQVNKLSAAESVYIQKQYTIMQQNAAWGGGGLGYAGGAGLAFMLNTSPGQVIPVNDPQTAMKALEYNQAYSKPAYISGDGSVKIYGSKNNTQEIKTVPELEIIKEPKGRKFK